MKAHADKTQGNKDRSAVNRSSQMKSGDGPTMQFSDNRPETVAQGELREMVNNSAQTKQTAQLSAILNIHNIQPPIQKKENNTGLPDNLKSGIENLSGYAMDDVKVHYNSSQPAQLNALAYAQGTDIHVAPGQERHLPHEAWHVVQQKQGRVRPTIQAKGGAINDDKGLEEEADMMGEKATKTHTSGGFGLRIESEGLINGSNIVQAKKTAPFDVEKKYAGKVANYSEYKDLDQNAYNRLIYDKVSDIYDENLNKGTRYWNTLNNALDSFEAEDNSEFLEAQNKKHADYDLKFNENYVSNIGSDQDSNGVNVGSNGLASDGDQIDPGKDVPYSNLLDFEDNSISANHNYAERDMAREQDVKMKDVQGYRKRGLPNSEILWQQYKHAAKSQFWFFKESRAKSLMKGLSTIKRRQVQNTATQMTILFALPDGKTNLEATHAWQAESEEFLAMLGTPNCSGAAFLLTDHVDELDGKSITEIKSLGGRDVNLDIKIG